MFRSTRLKLTAWYLLIIMSVSFLFSTVIYRLVSVEVERFSRVQRFRIERRVSDGDFIPPPVLVDFDLVNETKHRFLLILAVVNGGILVASGGLGYFLAGKTLQPIQEMVDEQNRFISDSSHELRTPLTSLKSAFEVSLRDPKLTLKGAKKLVAESIGEVDKLQSLSDELLELAQYQKPDGHTKFDQLSLGSIIAQAVKRLTPLAEKKNISIQNQVKDINVFGNKFGLTDLFAILLDNAVKYSPTDKVISLSSQIGSSHVDISIKDQGAGIDPKDLPRIFDRFYRADTARNQTTAHGYGLGLAIAQKIIDIHHGSIKVRSRLGKGSTFIVQLPFSNNS